MSCVYTSYSAQAFGLVLSIPFLVGVAFLFASIARYKNTRWGKQFLVLIMGTMLSYAQCWLWVLQFALRVYRRDPYCPELITMGFPSLSAFYVSALATGFILFTFVWNVVFSWFYWFYIFTVLLFPPTVLYFVGFNTWQEVLLSMLLGIATSSFFIILLRVFILEATPMLLNQAPFTWFSCEDTWMMNEEQQEKADLIREMLKDIQRAVPRPEGPRLLWASLY